ncbi:hypothetical protein ACFL0Y_00050 [Patescibacteria group bacterium]
MIEKTVGNTIEEPEREETKREKELREALGSLVAVVRFNEFCGQVETRLEGLTIMSADVNPAKQEVGKPPSNEAVEILINDEIDEIVRKFGRLPAPDQE